jgi:hypothetical protein
MGFQHLAEVKYISLNRCRISGWWPFSPQRIRNLVHRDCAFPLRKQKGEHRPLLSAAQTCRGSIPRHLQRAEEAELNPVVRGSVVIAHKNTTSRHAPGKPCITHGADTNNQSLGVGIA